MHFKKLLVVISIAISTQAIASEKWTLISSTDSAAVYLDFNSIVSSKSELAYRKADTKTVYLKDAQYQAGSYYITTDIYDCDNGMTDLMEKNIYSRNGKLLKTYNNNIISLVDIYEGSLMERLYRIACN